MLAVRRLRLSVVVTGCAAAVLALATPGAAQDEEKPYSIVDGKVDQGTYNGWRRYHASCHTCHGPDGLGSSYAPNLVDSMPVLSDEEFAEVVVNPGSGW